VAREPPGRNETIEGLAALASLIVMSVIVIALPPEPWTTVVPIALLFPVLLWIAARCRPVFAAAAAFIVTLAIVWTTTIGVGHFGDPGLPMADRVLAARAGILAVALCAYVLAALFAERRQHEAALAESEARLQEALTAGAVTTFVWDVGTGLSQRSADAAQILGFDPRQTFTPSNFLSRVHPDDRQRFKALVRGVIPKHPAYPIAFRLSAPTVGKSGSRKQQRPNSTPWSDLCASRVLLSTSPRASDPRTNKACSSPSSIITSRICWPALLPSPRTWARTAVHSTSTFKHSIGAYDAWPVPTRCSARVAGMALTSPNSSAVSLRPTERTQTRRSVARMWRCQSRRPRCWRWCCTSWLRTLRNTARCRPRMGGWK